MIGPDSTTLRDGENGTRYQHDRDGASVQSSCGHMAAPPEATDATRNLEKGRAVQEYIVRVQCSSATLFAFLVGDRRFISFDGKPRMVTRDDALEIQERLPGGVGQPAVSVEKVETREM